MTHKQFSARLPSQLVDYIDGLADEHMRARNAQLEAMIYRAILTDQVISCLEDEFEKDIRAAVDVGFKLGRAAILDFLGRLGGKG